MLIELKDAIKSEVLFRSEDGVDIFEGDKTCWINNWTVTNFADWKRNNNKKELHFSTKEAAEEYILMNKPQYSLNDIIEVFDTKRSRYLDTLLEELKRIKDV